MPAVPILQPHDQGYTRLSNAPGGYVRLFVSGAGIQPPASWMSDSCQPARRYATDCCFLIYPDAISFKYGHHL